MRSSVLIGLGVLALAGAAWAAEPVPTDAPVRPLSYDRPMTPADLEGRSLRELSLLRNTIYARVGNPFRKRWLHQYFGAQPWYHELPAPELQKLSDVDRANAALIEKAEGSIPRAELQRRRDAILQAHQLGSAAIDFLAVLPQGLLTAEHGGRLALWSLPEGKLLAEERLPRGRSVTWAIAAPDGEIRLLLGSQDVGLVRASWTPGQPLSLERPLLTNRVVHRAMIPATGDVALALSDIGVMRVDFAKRRTSTLSSMGFVDHPEAAAFAPDGTRAVIPTADGAFLLSLAGKPTRLEGAGPEDAFALAPDGRLFWTRPKHMLRAASLDKLGEGVEFEGDAQDLAFLRATQDGSAAIAASSEAIARYAPSGRAWRVALAARPLSVALAGDLVAVAGADHGVALFDLATGAPRSWQGPHAITGDDAVELTLLSRALGERVPTWLRDADADRNPLDDVELLDALLNVKQLRDLSRRDLKLLRHTVSARHGKRFTVPLLRDYFATKSWYRADPQFDDARLTELDRKNLKIIGSVEDELGGPLPDNQDHEIAVFRG